MKLTPSQLKKIFRAWLLSHGPMSTARNLGVSPHAVLREYIRLDECASFAMH